LCAWLCNPPGSADWSGRSADWSGRSANTKFRATTGKGPIYDGRFNMKERKPLAEENLQGERRQH
jgi:hypothetical protein